MSSAAFGAKLERNPAGLEDSCFESGAPERGKVTDLVSVGLGRPPKTPLD